MYKRQKENTLLFPERYILFVGRLSKVKNIAMAIRAFKLFHQKFPSYCFFVVGDGPEKFYLQNLVNELELAGVVRFIGCVSNPYPYISSASLVVLSSFSEAFPTILLESLSLGKTVVSTPTQGACEILDGGKLGYIIDSFDDYCEFAKMIELAIREPFNKETLVSAVYKQYDGTDSIKKIEAIW